MSGSTEPARRTGGGASVAILVVAFATLLGTLMQSAVVPLLPIFPRALDASPSAVSWLVTGLLVSGVVACAVFGRMADLFGKRRMLLVCLSALIIGSVICAVSASLPILIAGRVLQGFGMAIMPIGIGILRDLVMPDRLIGGIALISALSGIGGTLGATLGGVVAQFLPWQWLFVGTALFGIIAFALVLIVLPPIPSTAEGSVDILGSVLLAIGLVGILVPITEGAHWGWGSPLTLGFAGVGVVVLLFWGWLELRLTHPIVDMRLLASRPVLFTNIVTMLLGFGMYGIILATPQLAQIPRDTGYGLGASVLTAGLVSLPSAVFALLAPRFAARIISTRGPEVSITIGALVLAAGYALIIVWHSSIWSLVVAGAFVSVGLAFAYSATPPLLLRNVDPSHSAEATGVNTVFRSFGTTVSAAVVSAILAANVIQSSAGPVPSQSAFIVVFVVTGIACLAVFPALRMVDRRPRGAASATGGEA